MLFLCDNCKKKYWIEPSRLKGKNPQFTCKECHNVINVVKSRLTPFEGGRMRGKGAGRGAMPAQIPGISGMSIKTKITLIIVMLVIISLGAVGLIASIQSRNALARQAKDYFYKYATQKSDEYQQMFERINEGIVSLADYSGILDQSRDIVTDIGFNTILLFDDKGPCRNLEYAKRKRDVYKKYLQYQRMGQVFNSHVKTNPFLSLGYVTSEAHNGTTLMVLNKRSSFETIMKLDTYHPHIRSWYTRAKKEKKTIWTPPYIDADTKELIVTCATPVLTKKKNFSGVAGFDVHLTTIEQGILKLDIGYNSYAFLIDKQGKVLVRPGMKKGDLKWDSSYKTDNLLNTGNPVYTKIIRKMTQGAKGIGTYEDPDKGDIFIAYSPIKAINASMGIVVEKNKVIQPAKTTQMYITIACSIVLVLSIIIGIFIGNGITRPINELTRAADLISQGKMDLDVLSEERKDEIGILTKSFNRLVISLKMALSR